MSEPVFLTRQEVLQFHHRQIELFGGDPGIGDEGLLESALYQPQYTWIYGSNADLFDIAAAYAFHLSKNHPFCDGNKRTALQAALAFLLVNGQRVISTPADLYKATIRLTTNVLSKEEYACFLRSRARTTK